MSSSDEESLSERSCVSERSFFSERSGGSQSPLAHSTAGPKGDTLPWNLSKHERRKRESQDSVLDPAERAVVRVAGSSKGDSVWPPQFPCCHGLPNLLFQTH
ncbi:microtubule-actin cross-linking factor 1-like [Myxocyprinus asiaticus]|uniref:microtubule-actin cross-linking factor 1-like n=1 Tax=Myxocyprinus asiaticus TaxID=70543 RepID=UPI0022222DEB|nr:microtubule-actin cross-linking factor 1-like [Myxocyprinus asiaticus]